MNRLFMGTRWKDWLYLSWLIGSVLLTTATQAQSVSKQIIVDQFGWRPSAKKVVVFANPITGQNAGTPYSPGSQFQVRRSADHVAVFTGNVVQWNGGDTHTDSGDKVWHGDFSSLTTPGTYYVYDPATNLRSYDFELRNDIYAAALKASTRTFYYQRSGTGIPAQYGANWTHAPAHMQDANALLYTTSAQAGTQRNVTGGWYDAGDYNKYIPFLNHTLWNLMVGFELRPSAFTDNTNIPESGNGVPDMLDELKWELDWMLRMQESNGGVHNRVTVTSYENGTDDPSTDTQPRYYTNVTTWATATFAAVMAHAARLYGSYNGAYPNYANTLRSAAENAWNYLETNPTMQPASGKDGASMAAADAGSDVRDDKRRRVAAAAELFATTGTSKYKSFFEASYNDVNGTSENNFHPFSSNYLDASLCWELNRAYYVYAKAAGANPSVVSEIKTRYQNTMDWFIESYYNQKLDPYLGFMWSGHYTWGSNLQKALWAMIPILSVELGVNPGKATLYKEIAEEYLHYFHGRNPLAWIYLSNMGSRGANAGGDNSVDEFYHSWFRDGSARYDGASSQYGPPPGYIVGGPNQNYSGSATPPKGQPPMKAYRNWNTSYPEPSWEISEPAIYNQAGYTFLVAYFTSASSDTPPTSNVTVSSNSPLCPGQTLFLTVNGAPAGSTYQWNGPNGFSSTIDNPSLTNVSTTATGTYSVTVTIPSEAPRILSVNVTVNPTPTAVASSNTPVASGQTLTLSAADAGAGASYSWQGPNNYSANGPNQTIPNVTPATAGTYTLIVGQNGCSTTTTTVVSVTGTTPIPSGNSLIIYEDVLQAGWSDWSWSTTRNYSNTSPVYSGAKSLAVQYTSGWGALYLHPNDAITLSPYPYLTFWVHGGTTGGHRMQVVINSSGSYEFSTTANQWTQVVVPFASFGNPTTLRDIFIQDVTGKTLPAFYIDQLMLAASTGDTSTPPVSISIGSNSPVCAGQSVSLSAVTANVTSGATYNWVGPNGFTASVANPTVPNATTADTGLYRLTVVSNGQSYTASVPVSVSNCSTTPDPTPDPNAYLIYDDALKANWYDWSWSATRTYTNTAPVKVGSRSLAVQYTAGWGGLYLHPETPVNLSAYTYLQFWVHGGASGGQKFDVMINDNYKTYSVRPTANSWTLVNVPLSALGNPATLRDLYIQDTGGGLSTYYIDNLQLTTRTASARVAASKPEFEPTVGLFPNPVRGQQLHLQLLFTGFAVDEEVTVRLTDLQGHPLHQHQLTLTTPNQELTLNKLAPGLYLVMVQGHSAQLTKKLVVE